MEFVLLDILLIVFIIILLFKKLKLTCFSDFFCPFTAVFIGWLLYTFAVPIDMILFNNTWSIPFQIAIQALLLETAFLVSLTISYLILASVKRKLFKQDQILASNICIEKDEWVLKNGRNVGIIMTLLGFSLYIFFIGKTGGIFIYEKSTRLNVFLSSRGLGFFSIGGFIFSGGYSLIIAYAGLKKSKNVLISSTLIAIIIIILNLLRGNRFLPLVIILNALSSYNLYVRRISNKSIIFFGAIGFLIMQSFSFLRSYFERYGIAFTLSHLFSLFSLKWLNPGVGELSYSFRILVNLITYYKTGVITSYFSYLFLPLGLFPSNILKSRPMSFNEWYAFTVDPIYFQSGGGFGGSFVGESFVNFGIFGPFILGIVCGFFVFFLETRFFSNKNHTMWRFLFISSIPFLYVLPRLSLLEFVKYILFGYMGPFISVSFLMELLYIYKRKDVVEIKETGNYEEKRE